MSDLLDVRVIEGNTLNGNTKAQPKSDKKEKEIFKISEARGLSRELAPIFDANNDGIITNDEYIPLLDAQNNYMEEGFCDLNDGNVYPLIRVGNVGMNPKEVKKLSYNAKDNMTTVEFNNGMKVTYPDQNGGFLRAKSKELDVDGFLNVKGITVYGTNNDDIINVRYSYVKLINSGAGADNIELSNVNKAQNGGVVITSEKGNCNQEEISF